VLYAGYRYDWDSRMVGFMLAAIGVCSAIVQGALVAPAVRRFGERRVLLVGLLAGVLGFVIYGVAPSGAAFMAGVPVVALWGWPRRQHRH